MELAKAYVQIVPSAKGIGNNISKELDAEVGSAGDKSGASFGKGLLGKIAALGIAVKVGQTIAEGIGKAINEGAALQQSVGGIETLFKDSAGKVIENANNAFRTVGISANEYMENVTSFSASLLQGLGGNTKKAADIADMAMVDMADNANKFGSDMSSIQTAYQGFAKQNYTMLDNLKLGYGGTKSEMERLLKDAQAFSGVEYNLDNLSDVYEAIHVIQENLDIAGTTAKEASTTFSGAFQAMKASVTNLFGALSTGGDVTTAVKNVIDTSITFVRDNLLPMIGTIVQQIPTAISAIIEAVGPTLLDKGKKLIDFITQGANTNIGPFLEKGNEMIGKFLDKITSNLPAILDKGVAIVTNIANGIIKNLPKVVEASYKLVTKLVSFLMDNMPTILSKGADLVINLVKGFVSQLPNLISAGANGLANLLKTVGEKLPTFIEKGKDIIVKLTKGLLEQVPNLISQVPTIFKKIKEAFSKVDWIGIGKDIIKGIVNGIVSANQQIYDTLKETAKKALQSAKDALKIGSPSKLFANEVGAMIDAGTAQGIKKNANDVNNAVKNMALGASNSFNADFSKSNSIDYRRLGEETTRAFLSANIGVKVNNREFGRLVGGYA